MVWSTASFASLIIHSTGWEDISKLMNGPIAAASGVLVCYLPRICFLAFFTHSCLNICTDLSRVTTELSQLTIKEGKWCYPFTRDIYITVLAPVVQIFYGAINQINYYPVDKYYGYQLRYPLDRRRFIQWIALSTFWITRTWKLVSIIQTGFKSGSSFCWGSHLRTLGTNPL